MIPKGLFTDIALIVLSVGIFWTHLLPAFSEISADQDTILLYEEESAKVAGVNEKLTQLQAKVAQLSSDDLDALAAYVPSEVDSIMVQRDLLAMARTLNIIPTELSDEGKSSPGAASTPDTADTSTVAHSTLKPYMFSIEFQAEYKTVKDFLSLITENQYPLIVSEISIEPAPPPGVTNEDATPVAVDLLDVSLVLTTYVISFDSPEPAS